MKLMEILKGFVRKKSFTEDLSRNDLNKVLGLSDLTFLAIGSMVGSGIYVLTGSVARDIAGPSIVISYLLAAAASVLSAVCYSEFAARIPVTGSAYQFTYISVGEIWAFMVGWNVSFEHLVLAASISKGWSGYIDALVNYKISNFTEQVLPIAHSNLLSPYPDFLAGVVVLCMTAIVTCGVKLSSKVNIIFAVLNFFVVIFVTVTGFIYADVKNWTGTNGTSSEFFPYGWSGTLRGTATLIFSYVGYEVVAAATEEAIQPRRDVPLSLLISMSAVVLGYVGASSALTLMIPYDLIRVTSPFSSAFHTRGLDWAKYVVSVGALAGMTAALLSALLVVPRYLYAMARDGLLMPLFENINKTTKVPVNSTIVSGIVCFILSIIFNLTALVEFISIGQLLACTFVSICVIKLRYEPNELSSYEMLSEEGSSSSHNIFRSNSDIELPLTSDSNELKKNHPNHTEETPLNHENGAKNTIEHSVNNLKLTSFEDCNCGKIKEELLQSQFKSLFCWTANYKPGSLPFYSLLISILFSTLTSIMIVFGYNRFSEAWFIIILVTFILLSLLSLLFITCFNQDRSISSFKVPLVPFVPFASIIVNVILILKLNPMTWIRFGIWMALGGVVYFGYGYRHSKATRSE